MLSRKEHQVIGAVAVMEKCHAPTRSHEEGVAVEKPHQE
jgi:hypothetical protein